MQVRHGRNGILHWEHSRTTEAQEARDHEVCLWQAVCWWQAQQRNTCPFARWMQAETQARQWGICWATLYERGPILAHQRPLLRRNSGPFSGIPVLGRETQPFLPLHLRPFPPPPPSPPPFLASFARGGAVTSGPPKIKRLYVRSCETALLLISGRLTPAYLRYLYTLSL